MSMTGYYITKRPARSVYATILLIVYLAVLLCPLSSMALHSSKGSHGVAKECSGDCNICGCSPANRAAKTCCCSRKKAQLAAAAQHDDREELDCCKKETPKAETVISACTCPCGNEASFVLTGAVSGETLPFIFAEQLPVSQAETSYPTLSSPLYSRHIEPPVPPPKPIHS